MSEEHKWGGITYGDLSEAQKQFLVSVVADSNRNYFLQGCAGSGKTIIAAHAVTMLKEEQKKNVKLYGYGIKGFTLSLIEASAKHSSSQTNIENITEILNIGKELLTHRLEPLPGAEDTLKYLSDQFTLIMITKGDLFDQQRKIQKSGLSKYFSSIEIVSEKDEKTYLDILAKHNILPKKFFMVGNSLKSDILPVTKIGGTGIFIPHQFTWIHEKVDGNHDSKDLRRA